MTTEENSDTWNISADIRERSQIKDKQTKRKVKASKSKSENNRDRQKDRQKDRLKGRLKEREPPRRKHTDTNKLKGKP